LIYQTGISLPQELGVAAEQKLGRKKDEENYKETILSFCNKFGLN